MQSHLRITLEFVSLDFASYEENTALKHGDFYSYKIESTMWRQLQDLTLYTLEQQTKTTIYM